MFGAGTPAVAIWRCSACRFSPPERAAVGRQSAASRVPANARAWDDARPALAPLAGDVYAYLEVKLPDDATAMFSYHLFGLA